MTEKPSARDQKYKSWVRPALSFLNGGFSGGLLALAPAYLFVGRTGAESAVEENMPFEVYQWLTIECIKGGFTDPKFQPICEGIAVYGGGTVLLGFVFGAVVGLVRPSISSKLPGRNVSNDDTSSDIK